VELADVPISSVVTPGAKSNEPLIIANGGPDPHPTGSNSGVAKAVDALDTRVDRGDARNGADDHKRNDDSNAIDQRKLLSVEPQFSSSEKDISVVKSTSPNFAKHYFGTTGKPRVLAKRPATDRTSVRQAAVEVLSQVTLESRNTSACAGSCSSRPPPLLNIRWWEGAGMGPRSTISCRGRATKRRGRRDESRTLRLLRPARWFSRDTTPQTAGPHIRPCPSRPNGRARS
jgi:hypothetical protein